MTNGYIDIYCERTGPEYWSEPLNALTNLAFILSAVVLTRLLLRQDAASRRDAALWILVVLIYAIGTGSWLFHTQAQRWAMLTDIIPIAIFILVYTWYVLRRFAAAPGWVCAIGVAVVLAIAVAVPPLTGYRGGAYVAALATMVGIGGYLRFGTGHPAGRALLTAAALFAVSLALRTVDQPLCATIPAGTHFAWHLLNAIVLFSVARAMVLYGKRIWPAAAGCLDSVHPVLRNSFQQQESIHE